jgi:uncharacterized protein
MKRLIFTILLAAVLWTLMFSPLTAPYLNFWWMMTGSAATLSLLAALFNKGWRNSLKVDFTNVAIGVAVAALLWSIFWVGDKLSSLLFNFAGQQVDLIYAMKSGESPWLLSLLMIFIIGPAEEFFWRGYVQRAFSERWNPNIGFAVATLLYTLVHVGSCNFMLIMAALTAGVVWGLFYRLFPSKFAAIIISHALWDAAVFIWFPI